MFVGHLYTGENRDDRESWQHLGQATPDPLDRVYRKQGGVVDPRKIRSEFFENLDDEVTHVDMAMAMCHLIESGVVVYDENMDVKKTGKAGW